MNHTDHVSLLEGDPGLRQQLGQPVRGVGGVWADFGSGGGAFTLALADLIGTAGMIYSVDREKVVLRDQEMAMRNKFPEFRVTYITADFTRPIDLPPLDGIVMANSLHFVSDDSKPALLVRLRQLLKPGGQFLLVEYNVDRGNIWVPHPLSFHTWKKLAASTGYTQVTCLAARPSRFLGEIYSAIALRPPL